MKVVYLNPTGQLGGAEKALLDILASLKAADPQFSPLSDSYRQRAARR